MLDTIVQDQLEPYITGKITKAPTCGVYELDNHIRFKRNLTIIGGAANTGKTHGWMWVLFTWASCLPEEPKFLIFANENDNVEMTVMLIEWHCEKYINKASREEIKDALEWVNNHFQFMKQDYKTNLRQVLNLANNIRCHHFEFDGFFLDPYNSLQASSYGEHYDNAGHMRTFVKHTNTKLMVSMHVVSEAQRTRDKDGNIKVPHIGQLEHGSMWFNRSDDAVIIHRQTQNAERKYVTEIHVQKVKHTRSGGEPTAHDKPIELHFDGSFGGFQWTE